MERQTIYIFGLAAMIAALCWMGYKRDILGIFVALVVGAGITFLANKIELRRKY